MSNQIAESRFKTLNAKVKKCLIEAGDALEEIRDNRLYESGGFKSFKDYCESVGKSYHWAWRQIEAGKVAESVPEVLNEATAREVRKIALPQRRQIVSAASEATKGKLTAPAIKKAAAKLPERKKVANLPKDGTGLEIPPEIQDFWNRNEEAQHLLSLISKVKVTIEKAHENDDVLYRFVAHQRVVSWCEQMRQEIQEAISFAVCPKCNGVFFKDCPDCKKRGSLSKFRWGMIPEEIRGLRET